MWIGLLIGLSSSLHCIGMCGPISLAVPVNRSSNGTIAFGLLQYNVGRVLSYMLLGVLMGTIGMTLASMAWMQWLSIAAGILMIVLAWHQLFTSRIKAFAKIGQFVSAGLGRVVRSKSPLRLVGMGVLNGFLPCGMVYVALTNALVQGSVESGAMAMLGFGLGTIPAMFSVAFFAAKLGTGIRQKAARVVPVLLTVIGLLVIARGLNLGIPYISPKISLTASPETTEPSNESNQEVQMDCCQSASSCPK